MSSKVQLFLSLPTSSLDLQMLTAWLFSSLGRLWYVRQNRLRDEAAAAAGLTEDDRERLGRECESGSTRREEENSFQS